VRVDAAFVFILRSLFTFSSKQHLALGFSFVRLWVRGALCGRVASNPRAGSLGAEAAVACEYLAPFPRGSGAFFGGGGSVKRAKVARVQIFELRRLRLVLALLSPSGAWA